MRTSGSSGEMAWGLGWGEVWCQGFRGFGFWGSGFRGLGGLGFGV